MADTKISALTALTGASVDTAADVLPIVDTSATTTKKILIDELRIALGIATQAQQEAATSLVANVTPGTQQYHPSAAKAWVSFVGTAANPITVNAGYNISGTVTKNGTGDYTITFTTAFSSANYCAIINARVTGTGGGLSREISRQAGSFRFGTVDTSVALVDFAIVDVVFFGDQ